MNSKNTTYTDAQADELREYAEDLSGKISVPTDGKLYHINIEFGVIIYGNKDHRKLGFFFSADRLNVSTAYNVLLPEEMRPTSRIELELDNIFGEASWSDSLVTIEPDPYWEITHQPNHTRVTVTNEWGHSGGAQGGYGFYGYKEVEY